MRKEFNIYLLLDKKKSGYYTINNIEYKNEPIYIRILNENDINKYECLLYEKISTEKTLKDANIKVKNLISINNLDLFKYKRIINSGVNNPMFGKTHTEEVKEKQSKLVSGSNHPMFGKKHDDFILDKIKTNRNTPDNSNTNYNKPVLQYDFEGNLLAEYPSVKIAAKTLNIPESRVSKGCRGIVKNPIDFIFKYKNPEDLILKNSYVIKIGDIFNFNEAEATLINRFKVNCLISVNGEEFNAHIKDHPYLWEKRTIS